YLRANLREWERPGSSRSWSAARPRSAATAARSGCSRRAACPPATRSRSASWSGSTARRSRRRSSPRSRDGARRRRPRIGVMPAARFTEQLNVQIGNELAAHNQYLAVAVHYDAETMPRMAAFFYRQALEERDHAMMMVQYLLDTDADVVIPGVPAPQPVFDGVVAPVELALAQEKEVTEQINQLVRIAREEHDYASEQFLAWFVKEQVEEV